MSRFIKSLGAVLAVAMVLSMSACSQKANTSSGNNDSATTAAQTTTAAAKKEPVKLKLLTISSDEGRQKLMEEYIKPNVAKELPDVEIEYEGSGDLANKIKVYNASGELPDVWWSGTDFALPVINAGNQLDLKPYITKDGFIEKFTVKDGLEYKGGIYALNSGADTYFNPRIFYHKDIFSKHGIEIPRTFDEFVAVCKKLVDAGIQPISTPGKGGWGPGFFLIQNMIMIEDPDVAKDILANKTDFSNPVVKNALERIVTLAKAGAFGKGAANLDYGPAKELFLQNKAAMYMMFTWELPDLEANVPDLDFFLWPSAGEKYKAEDVIAFWGSPLNGYAVSAKSKNLEHAIKLAEFCVMQDGLFYGSTGLVTIDTGAPAPELKPLQQKNVDHYNGTSVKIPNIFLNTMDAKTSAEYLNFAANLMTGDYTADQFISDFGKIWAENTWFK